MPDRVLLVDDEPRIIDGLRRSLHGRYSLLTATSGVEGLAVLETARDQGDPVAVVVSDMRMPGMDGATFLAHARQDDDDLVAMVLSGQAELSQTIEAVNSAGLFRFLTKPCEAADLAKALDAALRQHQLVIAERELLAGTLTGAVDVLAELMSLVSPATSGRTANTRLLTRSAAVQLGLEGDWRLPVAAMLSQIGCVAVPGEIVASVSRGGMVGEAELTLYEGHPALARRLVSKIPRLKDVADWLGDQIVTLPDLTEAPADTTVRDPDALARLLFLAVTGFLAGYDARVPARETIHRLAGMRLFPVEVLDAVMAGADELEPRGTPTPIRALMVQPGMVLAEDVVTLTGMALVRKGDRITEMMAARITNFADSVGIVEPVMILSS